MANKPCQSLPPGLTCATACHARRCKSKPDDSEALARIHTVIGDLPTYGYRRVQMEFKLLERRTYQPFQFLIGWTLNLALLEPANAVSVASAGSEPWG